MIRAETHRLVLLEAIHKGLVEMTIGDGRARGATGGGARPSRLLRDVGAPGEGDGGEQSGGRCGHPLRRHGHGSPPKSTVTED